MATGMGAPVRSTPPGELEARISRLSASQRAALASRLDELAGRRGGGLRSGAPVLAAFVTVDDGWDAPPPTPTELRSHLQGLIPMHMVPSSILLLDELPRLPNGKVDTTALVGLSKERVEPETDWVPPRNEVERKLAAIWREVLQVDDIGVHDRFFELGGDSILSIHVTSRANQQGLGLSPNDLFNFPTIAELAARCVAGPPEGRPPLFMVQWGAKEAAQLRQHLGREQPLFCFAAHWHGAYLKLSATIEQMAEERLAELRSLQPSGPYFIGGYSMGVPIALEMARQLRHQGEQVPLLFVLDPPHRNRREEALVQAPPRRSLIQKLTRQVQALLDLPPAEWLRHLGTESVAQVRYRVLEPLKLLWIGAMRRLQLEVPEALWHHYVGTVYLRARSRYAYAPYDGDVVVFSGSSDSALETLSSWQDLVRGDLQIETFDGAHLDFTMDPELFARWAKRLTTVLTERGSGTGTVAGQVRESPVRGRARGTTTASPSTATAAR